MIITEANNVKHTIVFSDEEWNTLMEHREYCFKLMYDEDSNFEMSQEAFILLDNLK